MLCTTFLGMRVASDKLLDGIDCYVSDMVMGDKQLHCINSYNFDHVSRVENLGSVNLLDRGVLFHLPAPERK